MLGTVYVNVYVPAVVNVEILTVPLKPFEVANGPVHVPVLSGEPPNSSNKSKSATGKLSLQYSKFAEFPASVGSSIVTVTATGLLTQKISSICT